MSNLLRWVTQFASELVKPDDVAARPKPTSLEQRIAIGLVQARAAECRAIVGQLRLSGLTLKSHVASGMAETLTQQSHVYEQLALRMCDQYPPSAEPPAETCECGHTISQHSQGPDGQPGPCSTECLCRKYRQRGLSTVDSAPIVN